MEEITIPTPCDWHVHLRQGHILAKVAPETARIFGLCMLMPNTEPPVRNKASLLAYADSVEAALAPSCRAYYAIRLDDQTTPNDVIACRAFESAVAFKLYPDGVTNNSKGTGLTKEFLWNGLTDRSSALYSVLRTISDTSFVLSVHAETLGKPLLEAEADFLPWIDQALATFPDLHIVVEHMSTAAAVEMVTGDTSGRLAATITVHHPLLTYSDVLFNCDHACKPVCNTPEDRDAVHDCMLAGWKNIFAGTDTAPHTRQHKLKPGCHAGIFSAPIAAETYVGLFHVHKRLDNLPGFLCENGCKFYDVEPPPGEVTFVQEPFRVIRATSRSEDIACLFAGKPVQWRAKNRPGSLWHEEIENGR